MKLIKINSSLFDAFLFDGWENWSRWTRDRKGFCKQIGGEPVVGFTKSLIIKKIMETK